MDINVRTGQTKASRTVALLSQAMKSAVGEDVCMLMEIHGPEKEARTIERECLEVVQRSLLETEGETTQRLDGALKELNGLLKGLLVAADVDDVHMLLAILQADGQLHLSHAGRAEAYLVRQGAATQITEYVSGKPVPAFVHISSGKTEPRDVVVLSTQRLLRSLTPAQLAKVAAREEDLLPTLVRSLEGEGEYAALATLAAAGAPVADAEPASAPAARAPLRSRRSSASSMPSLPALSGPLASLWKSVSGALPSMPAMPKLSMPSGKGGMGRVREQAEKLFADLGNPKRKKRAHLLLLAGALAALLIVWAGVHTFTSSQRSKTRADLEKLVEQINVGIQTAENRNIIGDVDSANAILQQAEERAKQVMDNESGLFRAEALDLLDRIRAKKEEINNIIRIPSPRVVANLTAKTADISAQGMVGISDGEFIVHDLHDFYRVLLNSVDSPVRIAEEGSIVDAVAFPRYQSVAFLTSDNSVIEFVDGEPLTMKTEDTAGWVSGEDIKSYNRNLYVLSAQNKKIYKYERLANRYGAPVQYNVNGDLTNAVDMSIDGNVYVLKDGGEVLKFYRGEVQPFVIRRLPGDALTSATKIFKQTGGFYFLDPKESRVIVATDGGEGGESTYVRQYVLEGEQMGTLKDLYVDADETHLYVLDDKRVYIIDLIAR